MDYLCAKFGDFSFSRFGFYRADSDRQTDKDAWLICYHGVSNVQSTT